MEELLTTHSVMGQIDLVERFLLRRDSLREDDSAAMFCRCQQSYPQRLPQVDHRRSFQRSYHLEAAHSMQNQSRRSVSPQRNFLGRISQAQKVILEEHLRSGQRAEAHASESKILSPLT